MEKINKKTTISCTRRLEFDAAHRVMEHESKCKNLHGHRYVLEATFSADNLDTVGRIIDFGIIKEKLGKWLDDNWDHTTILFSKDKNLGDSIAAHTGQKIFYLPTNPTAENMAEYIFAEICPKLFKASGISCIGITIYETPNCKAAICYAD